MPQKSKCTVFIKDSQSRRKQKNSLAHIFVVCKGCLVTHGHDEERCTCHNGYERSMVQNSIVMIFSGCNIHAGENYQHPVYESLQESWLPAIISSNNDRDRGYGREPVAIACWCLSNPGEAEMESRVALAYGCISYTVSHQHVVSSSPPHRSQTPTKPTTKPTVARGGRSGGPTGCVALVFRERQRFRRHSGCQCGWHAVVWMCRLLLRPRLLGGRACLHC